MRLSILLLLGMSTAVQANNSIYQCQQGQTRIYADGPCVSDPEFPSLEYKTPDELLKLELEQDRMRRQALQNKFRQQQLEEYLIKATEQEKRFATERQMVALRLGQHQSEFLEWTRTQLKDYDIQPDPSDDLISVWRYQRVDGGYNHFKFVNQVLAGIEFK